jgi:DNA-binding GntR family transcriptional regulator
MDSQTDQSVPALPQLDTRRSLSDAVHQVLRDAITDGTLPPGYRLREVAIARQLSVSATPVREALRRLEREGLVTATSHRGAMVAEVSPEMMANLYELHETLESFAVRRAAMRGPHQLKPIEHLLARLDSSVELTDQTTFNRLDLQFHRSINELSGNPEIADLAEQTHRRIQAARARLDIHLPDRPRRSQAQHRQILDAIARGDADTAESLSRLHINSIREPVLTMLEEVRKDHSRPVRR